VITAAKRRTMYAQALGIALETQRPPICQKCWLPIVDGHSRYLHAHCADWLHGDVYRTTLQRRAIENYDSEQEAHADVECSQAIDPATGSAPAAGLTQREEL